MMRQAGLSLVELMIAIALGLVILAALTVVFVNSSSARRELENSAETLMSGEYALGLLSGELSQAGFYGSLASPNGTTDAPCATDIATWQSSLRVHGRGSNQGDSSTAFSCINPSRSLSTTDAIFIQRASTCIARLNGAGAEPGCDPLVAGVAYIQVSECGDQYLTSPYVLAKNTGTPFTLRSKDTGALSCAADGTAPVRKILRSIYFVTPDRNLQRLDLAVDSAATPPGTVSTIASGIENMQIEYGVDTNGDSSPDSFSSTPGSWVDVVGARVSLLARAEQASTGYRDGKTYVLGDVCSLPPTASVCPAPHTANTPIVRTSADEPYKRHVFTNYVSFINPVGRREQ